MKKKAAFLIIIPLVLFLSACGGQAETSGSASAGLEETSAPAGTASAAAEESSGSGSADPAESLRDAVRKSGRITLEEALDLAEGKDAPEDQDDLVKELKQLKQLKQCSGSFVQESKDTGNTYAAKVSFYYEDGELFCAVDYDGYTGEIKDGAVTKSEEEDYLYETQTKGDLYGREQDFHICFGPQNLHIMWADTCDYILTRGDGSAEHVRTGRPPFEETEIYIELTETIDKKYKDIRHSYSFSDGIFTIRFEQPQLKWALDQNDANMNESWKKMVAEQEDLGKKIYDIVHMGYENRYGDHADIVWVQYLRTGTEYKDEDYLLFIRDGHAIYNYAEDGPLGSAAGSGGSSRSTGGTTAAVTEEAEETSAPAASEKTPSAQTGQGTQGTASSGDRRALQKAKEYLEVMPFSASGLKSQLEYEGFSSSEAEYAVRNCGADWREQARLKAEDYLEIMSFSKSGLIEQLEYEGFTHAEASYGADMAY